MNQWDKYVWYSKKYDQFIIADRFQRTHTCTNQPMSFSGYVSTSFVFIGNV